jgi:hypothetical protein
MNTLHSGIVPENGHERGSGMKWTLAACVVAQLPLNICHSLPYRGRSAG